MNYNFTDTVRSALASTRDEAIRLQHDYVGTEHILLGLISEGESGAVAVLTSLEIDLDEIRERVEGAVREGRSAISSGELPYTSRGKKVLEFAMAEARDLGDTSVGTAHLLLGVIREEKGVGAQVLASLDVTLERARAETATLGPHDRVPRGQAAADTVRRIGTEPLLIWVFPGDATADDLADVYAAVSEVYRASGSGGAPVPDVDTLSDARDALVAAMERLRLKGGDLRLKPLSRSRDP